MMKKLFLGALCTLLSFTAMASDPAYHYLYVLYQTEYGTSKQDIKDKIAQTVSSVGGDNSDEFAIAMKEYCEAQLLDDMLEIMEGYYEHNVTAEDLQTLMDWQKANPRINEITSRDSEIFQTEAGQKMIMSFVTELQEIVQGKEVAKAKKNKKISKKFEQAFNDYYDASTGKETVQSIFDNLAGTLGQLGVDSNAFKEITDRVANYINTNFRTNYMNLLYEINYPIEDMQLVTGYNKLPAKQHENAAMVEMTSDYMNFIRNLLTHIVTWAEPKYPVAAHSMKEGLEKINQALEGAGKKAE